MSELAQDLIPVEAMLQRAAAVVVYPPAPALASRVLDRIEREPAPRPLAAPAWGARAAAAIATAAIVALGAALAVPQSRDALADFFGLGHVQVDVGPVLGPPPPVLSPDSFARPAGVAEVALAVDFPLRFPTRDGDRLVPGAAYLQGVGDDIPVAIFVYEDEGFDLYETRRGFFGKDVPSPELVHEITFDGHPALWIDRGGHIATFLDVEGRIVIESRRTVDRATLLWEEEGVTYRLEASLSQTEAIAVAESMR
jgi:hypothetical protein